MGWPKLDTRWWNLSMGLAATTAMSACGPTIFLEGEDTITDSDTDGPTTSPTGPTQPPPECMDNSDCDPGWTCDGGACVPYYDDYCLDGGCCYEDCCYGGCYYYECYSNYECGPNEFCFEGYCAPQPEVELPQCDEVGLVPLPLPLDEEGDSIMTLSFVDVDGNGTEELLVGRTTGAQLVAAEGTAFDLPLPDGQPMVSVSPGDFNADGAVDLAVSDGETAITILLGDGSGMFTPSSVTAVAVGVEDVFAVHWNSDEQLDLAARTQAGGVMVYIGNGVGGLTASVEMETEGLSQSLAVGSFNFDSLGDLVVASTEATTFFMGNDEGTGFMDNPLLPDESISGFRNLLAADFDGNEMHEVVAWIPTTAGVVTLETWRNTGDAYSSYPLEQNGGDAALGDWSGDGTPDFVLGGDQHLTLVQGIPGDQVQLFECQTQVVVGDPVNRIGLGDFDGDGRSEVAVATHSGANDRLQLFAFE